MTAKELGILTIFMEEEIGRRGHLGHDRRQEVIHILPLGFPPKSDEAIIAERIAKKAYVKIGTFKQGKDDPGQCCFVYQGSRLASPPSEEEMSGANPWAVQTAIGMWENELDPFLLRNAWQELQRVLGRVQQGYKVR
jgi:hypothetical protein